MLIEILGKDAHQIEQVSLHQVSPGVAQLSVITRDKWIGLSESNSWFKKPLLIFNQMVPTFCLKARYVPEAFDRVEELYEVEVVLTPENLEDLQLVKGLTFELQDKDAPLFMLVSRDALKTKHLIASFSKTY